MSKIEVGTKVFEGENGPVIAGIGGIMFLVGCRYLTKGNYRVEARNDKKSFTLGPAAQAAEAAADETEEPAEE